MRKIGFSLLFAAVGFLLVAPRAVAQLSYSSGQSVSPAFEGWEPESSEWFLRHILRLYERQLGRGA